MKLVVIGVSLRNKLGVSRASGATRLSSFLGCVLSWSPKASSIGVPFFSPQMPCQRELQDSAVQAGILQRWSFRSRRMVLPIRRAGSPLGVHTSLPSWKLLTNHFSFQNKHYFSQLQFAKYYPNSIGLKNWNFTDIIGLWGLKIDGTFLFQI